MGMLVRGPCGGIVGRVSPRQAHRAAPLRSALGRDNCCDALLLLRRNVETFLKAIEVAGRMPGPGFAAVKMTALGNPQLLERASQGLTKVGCLPVCCAGPGAMLCLCQARCCAVPLPGQGCAGRVPGQVPCWFCA